MMRDLLQGGIHTEKLTRRAAQYWHLPEELRLHQSDGSPGRFDFSDGTERIARLTLVGVGGDPAEVQVEAADSEAPLTRRSIRYGSLTSKQVLVRPVSLTSTAL